MPRRAEKALKSLLQALCTEAMVEADLADQQALTKQLALIFDFVLRFDDLKVRLSVSGCCFCAPLPDASAPQMTNPAIQNDFSYYRRILNRIKLSNKRDAGITVGDELANAMSLFFAYPTPMMNSLIKTTTALATTVRHPLSPPSGAVARAEGGRQENAVKLETLSTFLARMANSCYAMAAGGKGGELSEDLSMLCFRTITGSIILYDHVNPRGAFHKKTPIQIKGAVTVLKNYQGREKTDSLVNALRFNTVHLNEEETPSQFKQLLA